MDVVEFIALENSKDCVANLLVNCTFPMDFKLKNS